MSKLRVHNFAISLDGYGAGPRQGREHPLGVGGEELHGWYVGTRAFRDYLRSDPRAAAEYGHLKRQLAARHPRDREAYISGKSSFVVAAIHRSL